MKKSDLKALQRDLQENPQYYVEVPVSLRMDIESGKNLALSQEEVDKELERLRKATKGHKADYKQPKHSSNDRAL